MCIEPLGVIIEHEDHLILDVNLRQPFRELDQIARSREWMALAHNHPGIKERQFYRNAEGLSEDVRYYGELMRAWAWERIGHLYPQVDVPPEQGGGRATVIAWIWARTVPSPDPAFSDVGVPIASSFLLSEKPGKEAWLEPVVDKKRKQVEFLVTGGSSADSIEKAKNSTKVGRAKFPMFAI